MFLGALAKFTVRHKRAILATTLVVTLLGAIFGAGAAERLTPAGPEDPGSESGRANALIVQATHHEPSLGLIVLVSLNPPLKPTKPGGVKFFLEGISVALRLRPIEQLINADPAVGKVQGALDYGPNFVSRDGAYTYLTVQFRSGSERNHVEAAHKLAEKLDRLKGVQVGGVDLTTWQANTIVAEDTRYSILLAFPILLLLSLWFFRGLVAAVLPLLLGGTAVALTEAALRVATSLITISTLVLSVVAALGIGLAIDYSLLIISRFREELAHGSSVPSALQRTVTTAGRTVLFSGTTVALAFASLMVLPQAFFYSMGLGGALVTMFVCIAALTVLPALLALLGPRVNALAPGWLQRSRETVSRPVYTGRWYRFALFVMRRPMAITLSACLFLLVVAIPALGMKLTTPSMSTMPLSTSVRQVSDILNSDFRVDPNRTIEIVTVGARSHQLANYRSTLKKLPGVSYVSPLQKLDYDTTAVYVTPTHEAISNTAQKLVTRIRSLPVPFERKVTGATAIFMDLKTSLAKHLILVAFLVIFTTCLSIFLLTGSVVLPPKTFLMNLFTAAATLGIVVLVFQDGHFQGILGYPSPGAIEIVQPVVLVAILFGISTDYGVFLIDRIREAHERGASNEQAIALGLERTGRITTTAALLLCVAVGSLITSRIVAIREIGLGLAVAVLIDATVIRALLVPALMRILGDINWWSPAPLRRFYLFLWRNSKPMVDTDPSVGSTAPPPHQVPALAVSDGSPGSVGPERATDTTVRENI